MSCGRNELFSVPVNFLLNDSDENVLHQSDDVPPFSEFCRKRTDGFKELFIKTHRFVCLCLSVSGKDGSSSFWSSWITPQGIFLGVQPVTVLGQHSTCAYGV